MYATFAEQSIGEPIQLALDFSAPPPLSKDLTKGLNELGPAAMVCQSQVGEQTVAKPVFFF